MITFPEHARVDRFIAKENFYDKIDYPTKMLLQNEIARVTWEYKIAPETINVAAKTWPEIEVFRIELKNHEIPQRVLKAIDSNIPYPILFIITKGNSEKAIISYKEQNQKNANTAKTDTYFETDWNDVGLSEIKIDGLDIDTIYSNFIRQIAGGRLTENQMAEGAIAPEHSENTIYAETPEYVKDALSIKNEVNHMKEREKLQKQIAALDRRIKSEPSIGKKQKLAEEKYKLLQQLQ